MNDELTRAARGLIDEARKFEGPPSQNKTRVRAALVGTLGSAALTTTSAAVAAFKIGVAAKVAIAVTVASVAGGLAWQMVPSSLPTPSSHNTASVARVPAPIAVTTEVLAPQPQAKTAKGPYRPRRHSSVVAQTATLGQLSEETKQVAAIQRRLQAGDAAGALTLLASYQNAFKNGVLREESDAAQIKALIDVDRKPEACRLLHRFAARWPRSPHTERLKSSCR